MSKKDKGTRLSVVPDQGNAPMEISVPDETKALLSYFTEKLNQLTTQEQEIASSKRHVFALIQDVANQAATKLEVNPNDWTFDLDAKVFRRKVAPSG